MPISPCNNREGGRERESLPHYHYPVILGYYYRPLTVKCIRVSYFLVTACVCVCVCVSVSVCVCIYIYIYIYIYNWRP